MLCLIGLLSTSGDKGEKGVWMNKKESSGTTRVRVLNPLSYAVINTDFVSIKSIQKTHRKGKEGSLTSTQNKPRKS